uniref:L,D-transpeptidase family protein n=1 Tax=Rhodococcus sp. HNM0569 TaxID=2716340 RepID=UPI00146D7221|nr:hypothetical protein [Rhodococcus sp. HNM0569]NLU84223.1 hypothetical protein [Rhodococcus sp. HNM0569]
MTWKRLAVLFAGLLALFTFAGPAQAAPPAPWFADSAGSAVQVVEVDGHGDGTASVSLWVRSPLGWSRVLGPVPGFVGSDGITDGPARDGVPATPAGVFTLDSAFGTDPAPGGVLPYRQVDGDDWWVGDADSAAFDTHQRCAPGTCGFDESASENLAIPQYALSVVMGVNPEHTPGAGSAFFLHVSDGTPTEGCVAIAKEPLTQIVRSLLPGAVVAIRS